MKFLETNSKVFLRVSMLISLLICVMMCFVPKVFAEEKLPYPKQITIGRSAKTVTFPKWIWWKKVNSAKLYLVEVFDQKTKKKIFSVKTKKRFYKFPKELQRLNFDKVSNQVYYYFIRVAAIDQNNLVGEYSPCRWTFSGYREDMKSPPTASDFNVCADRIPAAINKVSTQVDSDMKGRNKAYKNSFVQVEGSSFLISNNDSTDAGNEFATAMLTSLRGLYWLNDRHGFEGSLKAKVTDYNELASQINPLQIEGRYHMRFQIPFFWKWLMPQFQLSFFTGFEYYQNSAPNNTLFTTGYQLYKFGGALSLPIFDNWDTGGEVIYGLESGGSAKIEMQGYLNYYITKKWSLGVGYRVHLLRVENESILPEDATLPLREVYGEAFGNLRFSF